MYKVIHPFSDLQDNEHPYKVGDDFPRKGVTASKERIAELSGSDNLQKKPLIVNLSEHKKDSKKKEN